MQIGLISDTHNDRRHVALALTHFRHAGVKVVLHAGDITDAGTLALFEGFDVWVARGNMDHDRGLPRAARTLLGPGRFAMVHTFELDGKRFALLHGDQPEELQKLLDSKSRDYIIVGHEHVRKDERVGDTRIINPGAIGGKTWHTPTCAILDTATGDLSWITL